MGDESSETDRKKAAAFSISGGDYSYLEDVGESINSPSASATVRMAVRWLSWAERQKKAGRKLLVQEADGTLREVDYPTF